MNYDLIEKNVLEAKKGAENGFTNLYNLTVSRAYYEGLMLCNNDDLVNEGLQLSYIEAFKKLDTLREDDKFWPWFRRIIRGNLLDLLRKRQNLNFSDLSSDDYAIEFEDERLDSQPDENYNKKETFKIIQDVIAELSDEQRICIMMFYYDEYKIKEISDILGVNENTVKSRLKYGKDKIKAEVDKYEKSGMNLYSLAPLSFFLFFLKEDAKDYVLDKKTSKNIANSISKEISEISGKTINIKVQTKTISFLKSAPLKVVLGIAAGSFILGAIIVNRPLEVKVDEFIFEYGELVSLEALDIFDTSNQDILNSVEVEINFTTKDENEYPEVGTYNGIVKYTEKNTEKEENINVIIEDTTPPLITSIDEPKLKVGSPSFNLTDFISIEELSEYNVDFDDSILDLSTVGTYPLTIVVKDIYDNQSEINLEVKIEKAMISNTPENELQRRLFYLLEGPNIEQAKEINISNWSSIDFTLNEELIDFRQHRARITGNSLDGKVLNPGIVDSEGNVFVMDDYDSSKKELIGNIFTDVTDKQWQRTRNDVTKTQFLNESKVDFAYFLNNYIYEYDSEFNEGSFLDDTDVLNENEAREEHRRGTSSTEIAMFYTAPSFKYYFPTYPKMYLVTEKNDVYSAYIGLSIIDDSYLEGMSDAEIRAQRPDVKIWEYDAQATNYLKKMLD